MIFIVSPSVLGCALQVYDTLTKNVLTPSHKDGDLMVLSNAQRLAAGCASGASACLVVFPLETLRTQAAMGQRHMRGATAYFRLAADVVRCDCACMHSEKSFKSQLQHVYGVTGRRSVITILDVGQVRLHGSRITNNSHMRVSV